jgi:hypothetical protein
LGKCFGQSGNFKELILEFFAPPSNFLVKWFINPNSFLAGLGFMIMFIFPCFCILGFGHSTEMVSPKPSNDHVQGSFEFGCLPKWSLYG